MKNKPLILLLLLSVGLMAYSQDYTSSNKKAIKLYDKANSHIQRGDMGGAMESLEQCLKEDNGFLEAHLMLADLLQDAIDAEQRQAGEETPSTVLYRQKAKGHLQAVVNADKNFFPRALINLGKINLADDEYDAAIKNFETFLELKKGRRDDAEEANDGIASARFRREAVAHPVAFEPVNVGAGVNSKDDEYLPSLTADGQTLVFTRRFPRRASTTASTTKEEDLYISTLSDGKWSVATRMPEPVNSSDNEGAQCISQDGRIMFYTACNRQDGGGRCDIYMCVLKNGTWSKPRNLGPEVNSGAWEGQPTFSIDGKTLYFVSNRKGGYGGMDIWKTTFEHGHWSAPVNLGPDINTKWDEMSPFIHFDDKTLYFASNRPEGMGGADLFVCRRNDDGQWGKPENLGYPINTREDDNNLIVSADGKTAYFASQRKGYGLMDIYTFEMPQATRPTVAVCFKGAVTDAADGKPVASDIRVVDLSNGAVVANTSSDSRQGEYIVSLPAGKDYAFLVSAEGYLFHSQNVEAGGTSTLGEVRSDSEWKPIAVDIALQPIVVGSSMALRNVFFETGQYALLPESEYELGKVVELLRQNPRLKVEIGGHTDNVGKPADNQRLSEQRAKAVRDYLISKGIAESSLTYKGYGESKPVASNDSEQGRAQNRRTEMKIIGN